MKDLTDDFSVLEEITGEPEPRQMYSIGAWSRYKARKADERARLSKPEFHKLPPPISPVGIKHVPIPPSAGQPVSMIVFQDYLYVAFQFGVYRKVGDGWEQVLWAEPIQGDSI